VAVGGVVGVRPGCAGPVPAAVAWRWLLGVAGLLAAVLVATSWRYGYHRDELYFLAAGRHLAWGYPDQPPLTPLLLRVADVLGGGTLVGVRVPSALAAAATVVLAGLTAAEMGGGRRAQVIAAGCVAVSSFTLVTGHFVTTTTFDALFSAALCWLVARCLARGEPRLLAPAGLVLGVGLLNKDLVGVFAVTLLAGVALVGPRRLLASRWLWLGGGIAALLGLPYLLWQARHGWPQVAMAGGIAGGDDEGGRLGFVPFQVLLVSPVLVPVWVAGLVRLLRTPQARPFRAFGVAYLLLAACYLLSGGKAYYLAGAYPVLLAAGGLAVDGWLRRGTGRLRVRLLAAAVGFSALVGAVVGLAVLPARWLGPVLVVNPDAGETVGWPALTRDVAQVWAGLDAAEQARAVILAANYGEAGAIQRYGPRYGLPVPYSGHNAYAEWAVPPDSATTAVVIGYSDSRRLGRLFARCTLAGRVDNTQGVDNDEQGGPIWVCRQPLRPWSLAWADVRHLG
jgi:4-amino-4-deoxy-L-arabinose transferase-like glycosyltransferase